MARKRKAKATPFEKFFESTLILAQYSSKEFEDCIKHFLWIIATEAQLLIETSIQAAMQFWHVASASRLTRFWVKEFGMQIEP